MNLKLLPHLRPCVLLVVALLVFGLIAFTPLFPIPALESLSVLSPWYFILLTFAALICGFLNLGSNAEELSSVITLQNFLKKAQGPEAFAPNLDSEERNYVLSLFNKISARPDVAQVYAGVLDDPEVYCSDRVFIYTAAPKSELVGWGKAVRAEVGRIDRPYQNKWFRSLRAKPGYAMWCMTWD